MFKSPAGLTFRYGLRLVAHYRRECDQRIEEGPACIAPLRALPFALLTLSQIVAQTLQWDTDTITPGAQGATITKGWTAGAYLTPASLTTRRFRRRPRRCHWHPGNWTEHSKQLGKVTTTDLGVSTVDREYQEPTARDSAAGTFPSTNPIGLHFDMQVNVVVDDVFAEKTEELS
jgi:hypothetical protein